MFFWKKEPIESPKVGCTCGLQVVERADALKISVPE